jgi:hypothetical protein
LFHNNYRTGRLYDTANCNVDGTGSKGFEKDETHQEAADTIVKLAEQLELEVDVADVEELLESHGAELSNEDLMELEAAKVAEQTEDEPVEEPRLFSTKEMAIAFREIASAMARFEKMDPNSSRFLVVNVSFLCFYASFLSTKRTLTYVRDFQ